MADPGDYVCACLYLGRVDHHMVYDAFLRNSLKGASLFSDFFCRFLFQLCDAVCDGGQPMQIYFMKKEKIPIPVSTVILMIVTIIYKLVLVVIGLGIVLFARRFLNTYLGDVLFIFYLGLGLNIFCVTFMMILVFHPFLAKRIMTLGHTILEKLHLLQEKEGRLANAGSVSGYV